MAAAAGSRHCSARSTGLRTAWSCPRSERKSCCRAGAGWVERDGYRPGTSCRKTRAGRVKGWLSGGTVTPHPRLYENLHGRFSWTSTRGSASAPSMTARHRESTNPPAAGSWCCAGELQSAQNRMCAEEPYHHHENGRPYGRDKLARRSEHRAYKGRRPPTRHFVTGGSATIDDDIRQRNLPGPARASSKEASGSGRALRLVLPYDTLKLHYTLALLCMGSSASP
jgi:hypothetical protein